MILSDIRHYLEARGQATLADIALQRAGFTVTGLLLPVAAVVISAIRQQPRSMSGELEPMQPR